MTGEYDGGVSMPVGGLFLLWSQQAHDVLGGKSASGARVRWKGEHTSHIVTGSEQLHEGLAPITTEKA